MTAMRSKCISTPEQVRSNTHLPNIPVACTIHVPRNWSAICIPSTEFSGWRWFYHRIILSLERNHWSVLHLRAAQQKHCHAVPFSAGGSRMPLCEIRKQHNRLHHHWKSGAGHRQRLPHSFCDIFTHFDIVSGSASDIQWKTTQCSVRSCKVVNQIQLISVTPNNGKWFAGNFSVFQFHTILLGEILTPGVVVQTDLKLIFGSIAYLKRDKRAHKNNLINIFRQKWVRHWFNGMDIIVGTG